ncbi:hypothetical protein PYCCODRAFT_1303902 [Trametes coccinea BRFM310]|uniref:Uncharacterized protein n=1 Tax=Trametes coccinea (strain BRFM310) TaxID=1353009 RepID=A0A1Y2I7G6_TRAC3|nr:hypothetical protein PYCCODRAFT_1303902 [Trametes coccinea BRFM310]
MNPKPWRKGVVYGLSSSAPARIAYAPITGATQLYQADFAATCGQERSKPWDCRVGIVEWVRRPGMWTSSARTRYTCPPLSSPSSKGHGVSSSRSPSENGCRCLYGQEQAGWQPQAGLRRSSGLPDLGGAVAVPIISQHWEEAVDHSSRYPPRCLRNNLLTTQTHDDTLAHYN